MVTMPLQCSTQWDGLGHIFDHGRTWNGRPADQVVTSPVTPSPGSKPSRTSSPAAPFSSTSVALSGTAGELPDGFAITEAHLEQTIEQQGPSSRVGRGDIVLVRTGQLAPHPPRRVGRVRRRAGARPVLHDRRLAPPERDRGDRDGHLGIRGPTNEFHKAFQPLHQVAIPHIGLFLGEMWNFEGLADACAADGRYDCHLVAAPLPITGAVGSPVNPIAVR